MARKLPGLARVLGTSPSLSVAYGEIGSSIYFALGIVALYALGLTPWVLLGVGLARSCSSRFSYAEGDRGDAGDRRRRDCSSRRAFNDPAGFLTGWVLFLDYLIVIALAGALRAPLPRRGGRAGRP